MTKSMKPLFLLFLMMFFIGTDTFLISPLLPTLQKNFAVSPEFSGWMVSAYALGYSIFALIAGPLSDRWNRKKVMQYGLLAFAATTALCGLADGFYSMLVFRFLAGVSAAFVSPQIWAAIPFLVFPTQIVKAMGIVTAGLSASQLLGVPLGSLLADFHWSVPFFILGGFSLLLILPLHRWIPTLPAQIGSNSISIVQRFRNVLAASSSKQAFIAYFIFQMGNFAAFSYIGTYLTDSFSLDLTGIGATMMLLGSGNLLGSLVGGHLVQRFGSYRTFATTMAAIIGIYLLLPFAPGIVFVKALFVLVFLAGGMLFPIMMGSLQTIDPASRGTIASLANSLMYGGATIGSALAGLLYARLFGFHSVSLFAAACFLVSLLLFAKSRILIPASSASKPPTFESKTKSDSI